MMKAVVKAKAEPGLWLEEVPVPEVGSDEVLIRVLKASICGTDVHIYNWDDWAQKTIPVPMTIGHGSCWRSAKARVFGFCRCATTELLMLTSFLPC